MDSIFGFENKQIIELKGISSFKEHFSNHIEEDFNKDIELHLFAPNEIKCVRSRLPEDSLVGKWDNLFLEGSPFMIALVLGEFAIAENILDLFPSVSVSNLGKFNWRLTYMSWDGFDFMEDNTIEILLYANTCKIPEQLRNHILQRMVEEEEELSNFSLKKVKDLRKPEVQKLLVTDYKKYPKLFAHEDSLYAHDIETLYFLLKVFQDETLRNRLLTNNVTGLKEKLNFDKKYDLSADMKCIGSIVKMMLKYPNSFRNLYIFLLKILSQIQMVMLKEDADINLWKKCKEYQEFVWKMLDSLPFDEEVFKALNICNDTSFLKELLYELAEKRLKKKMPLYINSIWEDNLMIFFGLVYEEDFVNGTCFVNNALIDNTSNKVGKRLMQILRFVSRIEYPAYENNVRKLEHSLKTIISNHAEELKDSFPELLAKGFIPDECLDSVMRHASRVSKCAYMRPLLIMQKFGGIIHDEG